VVDERVDETAPVAREGGVPAQVHAGGDGDLAQAPEGARLVRQDNGEVRRVHHGDGHHLTSPQTMRLNLRAKSADGSEPRPSPTGPP
jgi:hypothetical protein